MDEPIGLARDRVLQRMAQENLNLRIELEAMILRLQQSTTLGEELAKSLEAEKALHAPADDVDKAPEVPPPPSTTH